MAEAVNHPAYYGGAENPYEAIKVIEAWQLGFCLGNTVKYIARSGKKPGVELLEDLRKAAWYLNREIQRLTPPAVDSPPVTGDLEGFTRSQRIGGSGWQGDVK